MLRQIEAAINKYGMLSFGDKVAVGLSGGADSVALLLALCGLREKYGITLFAVHINHMLRGDEAMRDEKFAVELCNRLEIPITVRRVPVAEIAEKSGESIELAARKVRYDCFAELSVDKIATAHNADDNLETVVYNITRGSGINGAGGIPPVRGNIIRPLITTTRDEILRFLADNKQSFVVDSSNASDDYTRNIIRHHAVPVLKQINSGAVMNVARFSDTLREDAAYLSDIAQKAYRKLCLNGVMSADIALQQPPIQKRVLRIFAENTCGKDSVTARHIDAMLKVVCGSSRRESLPYNMSFCKTKSGYVITKNKNREEFCIQIDLNSAEMRQYFSNCETVDYETYKNTIKVHKLLFKYSIDCDKIVGNTSLRTRKDGDAYRPVGRNVTKTLRKLLCESAFTPEEKRNLLFLCDEKGIVFTNLFGIDERVRVDDGSKRILIIKEGEGSF